MNSSLQVMANCLSDRVLRIEFLRLRCGTEQQFGRGLERARLDSGDSLPTFAAFSGWDAVLFAPCSEVYPRSITDLYADPDIASSVSGASGYLAYLWDHTINRHWQEDLDRFAKGGPSILVSVRFADWFRRDVGLGAEHLFCDALERMVRTYPGLHLVVAHSLGWHDAIVLLHTAGDEADLVSVLTEVRLLTLQGCIDTLSPIELEFSEKPNTRVIADSNAHLLGGFETLVGKTLSLGNLASVVESARVLVRIPPSYEWSVRKFLHSRGSVPVIADEIGHYNLSIDISSLAIARGGKRALALIADIRQHIARLSGEQSDSYSETTTTFRFKEAIREFDRAVAPVLSKELSAEIVALKRILTELPHVLDRLGVSSLTKHRFVTLLVSLLGYLSDPVRSPLVRYISRFASTMPDIVRELEPAEIDDLCHSFEYALGQAIDGSAQSEHAGALMRGQSGYSRLTIAVEWYLRSTFARLGVALRLPLITFGLRGGNTVSTGRFQIDIPFNVLFVPSRWHILLHEIGHLAWLHTFGWMTESLAIYRAMERDIRIDVRREVGSKRHRTRVYREAAERVHIQFLRTRDVVRELFPSYLMLALPCGGDIEQWSALTLRHTVAMGYSYSVYRELIVVVVLHCLLKDLHAAVRDGAIPKSGEGTETSRAAAWWRVWDGLRSVEHNERIRDAVDSISTTLSRVAAETDIERPGELRGRMDQRVSAKMQILHSRSFHTAAGEMVQSVVEVLALRGRLFRDLDPENIGPRLFGRLLDRIGKAQSEASDPEYIRWMGAPFAGWLSAGEVLTRHRDSYIWSRLLTASREQIVSAPPGTFLRGQLSVLLSMWHDATTESYRSYEDLDRRLRALNVVRDRE